MNKKPDLHLHFMDQFDSPNDADAICIREKELGAEGFALTQHGTLSGIEIMRKAAGRHNLKFVPGCEFYYGNKDDLMNNEHLIILAEDYEGYRSLFRAVTAGQNSAGYAVLSDEILSKYFGEGGIGHGHVTATSACIQGPLAAILRTNEIIDRMIEKLTRKYDGAIDISNRLKTVECSIENLEKEILTKKHERDNARKLSEIKFTAREKRVEKLKENHDSEYGKASAELESDKKASRDAETIFESLKKEVAQLLKEKTLLNQEKKKLDDLQEKYIQYSSKVAELQARKKTKEELEEAVKERILYFVKIFGKNHFYIELQYHGIELEAKIYPVLAKIAKEMGVPVVATNDVHIVTPSEEERLRRQILRSLRFGNGFIEESVGDKELYIKTDEEMVEWLSKILPYETVHEAMDSIQIIFDHCNVVFPEGEKHYPTFPVKGISTEEKFDQEIKNGIKWRFPNGMTEGYKKRLDHEINVIKSMGYMDYHLIVKDFLEFARIIAPVPKNMLEYVPFNIDQAKAWVNENGWKGGISVGPGRGSAVGSLVCYILGITSLDPIRHGLLFERFLNPERVSMPDIDVDLSQKIRKKTIEYVQHKYGKNAVCGIMTTNALAPKGAIRIAAKFYGFKKVDDGTAFINLSNQMAKTVPKDVGICFNTIQNNEKSLYENMQSIYSDNKYALEILKWAKTVEGSFTTYGAHAAGIVISDNDSIGDYMPLRWNQKLNEWTTMFDMVTVEEKGHLKMDFLGLKTLDILSGAASAVYKRTGKVIDFMQITTEDTEVYKKIFAEGNTNAVFQFESTGMKSMLKRFKPSNFDDLVLLVAAYRPGPIQYLNDVIEVKSGKKKISYVTPLQKNILDVTYGYPIYQEQVMALFQALAGYTLGGADIVRRYMSKKKIDKLIKERESFVHGDLSRNIKGCVANGITEADANEIFEQLTEFAKYAFNRSHAAAYALVSYWTAWFKCHYPAEFLMEALNWAENDEETRGLIKEANKFGVQVLAPDINYSDSTYSVVDGKILYGLSSIKMVGVTGDELIKERQEGGIFTSLKDFFIRVQVKKNAIENLIKAGAFDSFCKNRQAMLLVIDVYKKMAKKYTEKMQFVNDATLILNDIDSCKTEEQLMEIQSEKGIAVLDKLTTSAKLQQRINNARKTAKEAYDAMSGIVLASDMNEDINQRLNEEHELLGTYVTGHPLDQYDMDGMDVTPINDISSTTSKIFGIITDLNIKSRKSDGKPIAFITLEDKTGTIDVSVFADKYTACSKYLTVGSIVVIFGHAKEGSYMTDDEGNTLMIWKFIAKDMITPKPTISIELSVSSYAVFHVTEEENFRKKYEDPDGCKLIIFDQILQQKRNMKYRVKKDVKNLKMNY